MIPYFVIETIQLGPVTIQVWGLLVAIGFLLGATFAEWRARQRGFAGGTILDLALWVFVSGVFGARTFYVLGHFDWYVSRPSEILNVREGGLAFFGGFIGALIAAAVLVRMRKLSFWKMADIVAPAVALGYLFGRIGCFLIHDHLGRVTGVPWGVTVEGVVRHETSLYEAIFNGLFLCVALIIASRKIKKEGVLALAGLLAFVTVRFFTDLLRATDLPVSDIRVLGFTGAQYMALVLFLIAAVILWKRVRQKVSTTSPER